MTDYLHNLFRLEGKTAALIGAGGFLLGEMSGALAKAGCHVAVIDQDASAAKRVADEIAAAKGSAIALQADITRHGDLEKALAAILQKWGRVDVLVNGAGLNAPTPFLEITQAEWDRIFAVQLTGPMLACQVFGAQMLKQGAGSIINIASASSGPPLSKAFAYSAAKSAVKNLTQNLAREWGTKGVRVNALRPGFFPTEWSKQNFLTPDRVQSILNHTPMRRFGEPHELVGAVLWLASEASGFVTGAEIAVDGGFTAMTI